MPITADELRKEIANLEEQAQEAANTYQQAVGALALARALLANIEAVPIGDFAQAIGGNGATAEITEVQNG